MELSTKLKNIAKGMASIAESISTFQIFPQPAKYSAYKLKTTQDSIRSDWEAIENDFRKIINY